MASPKLGHVADVYGFISTSINLIGTKLHKKLKPPFSDLTLQLTHSN